VGLLQRGADLTLVGSLLNRFSEGSIKDAGLLEGVISTATCPTSPKDNPWVQLFRACCERAHGARVSEQRSGSTGCRRLHVSSRHCRRGRAEPDPRRADRGHPDAGRGARGPWSGAFATPRTEHAGISGGVAVTQITRRRDVAAA
jgi:hypothetical protein